MSTYTSSNNIINTWDSVTSFFSSAYGKAKDAVSLSLQSNPSAQSSYTPQPSTSYTPRPSTSYGSTMGGKRRRKSRRMRGGNFTDNTSRSGLASTAAPISGIRSAQPHSLVGGRTRRRSCNCSCKNKHSKSCRSRKR